LRAGRLRDPDALAVNAVGEFFSQRRGKMYTKPQLQKLGTLREITHSTVPTGTTDSTFHTPVVVTSTR
jgi:hypothetical protein